MKTILCLILISVPVLAQTKNNATSCQVTIDQIQLIRGLRLGQSYDVLNEALPRHINIDIEPDELGFRRLLLSPSSLKDPQLLNGVRLLRLIYLDDSLINIEVTYDDSVKWQSNLHFVAAIAQQLNLPRKGWRHRDPSYLRCPGYIVVVSSGSFMPSLKMWDLQFSETIEKRAAEVEEKKRSRFRP